MVRGSGVNPTLGDEVSNRGRGSSNCKGESEDNPRVLCPQLEDRSPLLRRRMNMNCITDTTDFDPHPNDDSRIDPKEETTKWHIGCPGQNTQLSVKLEKESRDIVTKTLTRYKDLFAWIVGDM